MIADKAKAATTANGAAPCDFRQLIVQPHGNSKNRAGASIFSTADEQIPQAPDSERAIVGALILSRSQIAVARAQLSPQQFFKPSHRAIYEAILALDDRSLQIDPILLVEELRARGTLDQVGGPAAVAAFIDGSLPSQISAHIDRVIEAAQKRKLWAAAMRAAEAANNGHTPNQVAALLRQAVEGVETDNQPAPEAWETPTRFYEFDLPIFPVEVLPTWLRDYVAGLAEATQTPVALPAMLVLAALAAAVARRARIIARDDYSEPLNLYVVAALLPGNRKSAVIESVVRPLRDYERDLVEATRDEIAEAISDYRVLESRWEKAIKDCAKLDGAELERRRNEARELKRELDTTKLPVSPQLIADDITSEELASKLAEQGGRMAVFSAEGGIFGVMAGRYSSGSPNIDVYLKSHPGDDLRINRRNRAEHVKAPAVTLGLSVQPDVIRGLADNPSFRGRGLVGRILYALPASTLGARKIRATALTNEVKQAYSCNLIKLAQIQPYGPDPDQARLLKLTKDADDLLAAFEEELEPQLSEYGELGNIADWASKLAGAVLRLAGLLHLAENVQHVNDGNWPGEVSANTVRRAITIGRYLIPHAKAAYAEMGADPKIEGAMFVLRWLERDGRADLTKRDIYQGVKGRFREVATLEPALQVLEDHGYIRPLLETQERRRGRKASQIYKVNPFLTPSSHNSHNSHNSELAVNSGDCGNCGNQNSDWDFEHSSPVVGEEYELMTDIARPVMGSNSTERREVIEL